MHNQKIIIGIGGNIKSEVGDHPIKVAIKAISYLKDYSINVTDQSRWYETEPIPKSDQPNFFNCIVFAKTVLNELDVLNSLHDIEYRLGRRRILVNEAKKRGLHTAKNPKGIDEFPYLRTLVEDFTTDETFGQAGLNVNPSMQMVRETPPDLVEEMRQMRIRSADRIYKDKVDELRKFTDFAEEKIQDIAERARQEELQRKADGGSVQGIASLSNTARDMYRGPRGIGSYQQFMSS